MSYFNIDELYVLKDSVVKAILSSDGIDFNYFNFLTKLYSKIISMIDFYEKENSYEKRH